MHGLEGWTHLEIYSSPTMRRGGLIKDGWLLEFKMKIWPEPPKGEIEEIDKNEPWEWLGGKEQEFNFDDNVLSLCKLMLDLDAALVFQCEAGDLKAPIAECRDKIKRV